MPNKTRYTRGMSTNTQALIDELKEIARERGISISELARLSGVERAHLSRLLNGQSGVTIATAQIIAEALGGELDIHVRIPANLRR